MVLEEFLSAWNDASDTVTVQTSGSTGTPKTMRAEKLRMLASARITCDFLGLRSADTALLCMILDYIGAKMMVVRALERQMKLVTVAPTGHPFQALPPEHRVPGSITFAAMVPLQIYNTLQIKEETDWLRSIRHLIIGGGAIDEDMEQILRTFPNHVWSTYGMTETLSHIALRRISGPDADEWYKPFDGVAISRNADGCLVIEAPEVHDGPLVTHDCVEICAGKGFRILGRKDNMIVSGGVKIQIEEVERRLKPHLAAPYVITKTPDRKFGERVVLLTEDSDMQAVAAVCAAVLPKFWVPGRYIHVSAIPMTATGKPARAVAERIAATQLMSS